MSGNFSEAALRERIALWLSEGKRVGGVIRLSGGKRVYAWLASAEQLDLHSGLRPANSIKQFFFPPHEKLFGYRFNGKQVELTEAPGTVGEQVIIADRPCDAAALPILDPLFNWDYKDSFYNRLRQTSTVITFACTQHDDACFCTSAGCGPEDSAGSDVMMYSLPGGEITLRTLSGKGHALFADVPPGGEPPGVPSGPDRKFDEARVAAFLAEAFESSFWGEQTVGCLGCGICASTCPVCHCFDIVDESNGKGGWRVKNWDYCQSPGFTRHASGHNPRTHQEQRQRQRIYHKFEIYRRKFGRFLCTGCGNCVRNCPAGLGVLPVLEAIPK